MKAEKWNFEKQEYEEYELPDNCPLICYDMEKIINRTLKVNLWFCKDNSERKW